MGAGVFFGRGHQAYAGDYTGRYKGEEYMSDNIPVIKVLHIGVSSEEGFFGGVEKFLLDYYQQMDQSKVIFDFLFCRGNPLEKFSHSKLLENSHIYFLEVMHDKDNSLHDYIQLYHKLIEILDENKYDVVHVDTSWIPVQTTCLIAAKKTKCKIRIAHSHSSGGIIIGNVVKRMMKRIIYSWSRSIIRVLATDYFACSKEAGEYIFGTKGVNSDKFKLIHNAINVREYSFDEKRMKKLRSSQNIEDDVLLLGCIGRLDPIKNLYFSIDIVGKLNELGTNTLLWIIGDGSLENNLKEYVKKNRLEEKVVFWGERHDIPDLVQALDGLLFPSLREGLGIVAIEAQAAGIPVYASDTVPSEVNAAGLVEFISLNQTSEFWAKEVANAKSIKKKDTREILKNAGYDIQVEGNKLQEFYIDKVMSIVNEN
jgi:glycosyltransferase involved in cell wall biosynthesis